MRVRDSVRVLLLVTTFLALLAAPCHAQVREALLYEENFEDEQAQGWELEEPGWAVDNRMLNGHGHTWARYTGDSWGDASFYCKLESNGVHVNVRNSETGRYAIGFRERDGTLFLYLFKQLWPDEFFLDLATNETKYDANETHGVEISTTGGRIQVTVDGTLVLDYTDPDPLPPGSIAFETLDDTFAQVDDIVVYGPVTSPTPLHPALTLNPASGVAGSEVIATGTDFDVYGVEFAQATLFFNDRSVRKAWIEEDGSFSTTFTVPFDAEPGRYEVTAEGPRDSASAEFEVTPRVSISDTTLPSISITSPANGQTFTTATIAVCGTASDNVALSKVEVRVGAGSWQLASGTTSWSGSVTLNPGSNTIYARATDTAGNTRGASVTVTYSTPVRTPAITPAIPVATPVPPSLPPDKWLGIAIITVATIITATVILRHFIKPQMINLEVRGGVESPGESELRHFEINVEERGGLERL